MKKFLIRTPFFSLDDLKSFLDSEHPEQYIYSLFKDNYAFKESIYLYSKLLYRQASQYIEKEDVTTKKRTSVANSLIKYYLRMCYRSTPFGISAGVSVANYEGNLLNAQIEYKKRSVKIDSAVICNILIDINAIADLRFYFKYYTNNTVFNDNEYFRYIEKVEHEKSFDFVLGKVENTEFINTILEKGREGITINDFIVSLSEEEDISEDEIKEFFNELIDLKLLVNDFQYDILDIHFENNLIKKLKDVFKESQNLQLGEIIKLLETIKNHSETLEGMSISSKESIDLIITLDKLLEPYNKTEKSSIQIDLINKAENSVSPELKKNIKKNIPFLFAANAFFKSKNSDLDSFKNKFKSTYGNKLVPILEAIDPDIGIGYPIRNTINYNSSLLKKINIETYKPDNSEFTALDQFLLSKYETALRKSSRKITLSTSDLKRFEKSAEYPSVNDSIMFTGQVFKDENQKLTYFLNSFKVGAAHFVAGRFAYGNSEIRKMCKDLADFEKQNLNPDQVYTDILHLSQPKLGNVALRPNYYDYFIPIIDIAIGSENNEIALNDISISVHDNEIFLYSKKLKKQIIPRLGCAQNTSLLTSPIYKFLGAITDSYYLNTWDWRLMNSVKYLPRVQYDNCILSKERWILTYNNVFTSNIASLEDLKNYIEENRIIRNITLSLGGDNLLPIDLQNSRCLDILYKELKNKKRVILEECLYSSSLKSLVSNEGNMWTNEICVPMFLNLKSNSTSFNEKGIGDLNLESDENSVPLKLFPFREVLYLKIYFKGGINVDQVFTNKLCHFMLYLEKNFKDLKFFFIRYIDPSYHFRLRFFMPKVAQFNIIEIFNDFFDSEIKSSIIADIKIDTYERELERYGGNIGVEVAENIFHWDSLCVLKLISWIDTNNFTENKWLIAMAGVHSLLNDFSVVTRDRITSLESIRDYYLNTVMNPKETKNSISLLYRKNKQLIGEHLSDNVSKMEYVTFYEERSYKTKTLIAKLKSEKITFNEADYIHMFLNRFFETNQNLQELIIYHLLIIHYNSILYHETNT
jgi:thiopeptide-type bacteriocin biosynthesis protein